MRRGALKDGIESCGESRRDGMGYFLAWDKNSDLEIFLLRVPEMALRDF